MSKAQLKGISIHIKFLKRYGGTSRYCNADRNGNENDTVHPLDVDDLLLTRERLVRLTVEELDINKIKFIEVANLIYDIDALLSIREIGISEKKKN